MSSYPRPRKKSFSFSSTVLIFTVIFLFIPLFVVTFFSLNSAKGMQWEGASLIWYKKLIFDSPSLWTAFRNSLIIALSSSATAVVLGSLAAVGIKWYRFGQAHHRQLPADGSCLRSSSVSRCRPSSAR